MTNVLQISLESLLLRATNPNNSTVDNVALDAFYALINKERDGPCLGVRVIASRLPVGCEKEVLSVLSILDACMTKCGIPFQNEVGKFRFLNEMIKLVSPKYLGSKTPLSVKQRVLQLLYLWTLDYPKEPKIKEAFDMLRKQGVIRDIPNPNIPQEALGYDYKKKNINSVFQDEEKSNILRKLLQSKDPEDIQAANWLIKSMVKEDEKLADLKSKAQVELEPVQNNIKLLNEMMESHKKGDSTMNELDLMSELHGNLVRFKPTLKSMACTEENCPSDLLESILKTMDEVTECLTKYNDLIKESKSEKSKSNLAALLELDQQAYQESGPISLIQMEQSRESKGSIGDCSCSSQNGSSQVSQISSTTSKSSIDVLCDVFSGLGDVQEDIHILQPITMSKSADDVGQKDDGCNKKVNALEDLDVLTEHLKKENLPSSNRIQEKIPMNLLSKINEIKRSQERAQSSNADFNYLLENTPMASSKSDENLNQVDSADDCLVDISEERKTEADIEKEKLIEVSERVKLNKEKCEDTVKLKDISIKLEDIKPSSNKSITALDDRNGITVLLHKAIGSPKPAVSVYVITTMSKNELPLNNYLFQAVAPKGCKLRLLTPSATELPAFNPFLPPSAITQILLVANEPNLEKITLKFVISYIMDDDNVTEMGEIKDLLLEVVPQI